MLLTSAVLAVLSVAPTPFGQAAPVVAGAPVAPGAAAAPSEATRVYRVRQTARLSDVPLDAGLVRWWVSIPGDQRDQDLLDFEVVSAPGPWRIECDSERGNRFLYVEAREPEAAELQTVIEFTLRRRPVLIAVDAASVPPLTEEHRRWYAEEVRHDAPHMQVDAAVLAMANEVCGDETNPALQARALLQHVMDTADHYSKDPQKPNCGIGDAGVCMEKGGGCCTDLHSLFIALARARGIPARLQMGYRLNPKNVGKDYDPGYRCWAEYFLPGLGWIPTDVVEADATGGLGPERWFTGLTEWRLWLNQGREFALPSSSSEERVNTMIIGHAEIDGQVARVLPDGDLKAQLARTVQFEEIPAGETAALAASR